MNNFVSLIVNNAGEYTAAITRKVTYKDEITTKSSGSYPFYSEEILNTETTNEQTSKERTVIEWFYLNVIKPTTEEDYYADRFNTIRERKGILSFNTNGYKKQETVVTNNVAPNIQHQETKKSVEQESEGNFGEDFNYDLKSLMNVCPINKTMLEQQMLKLFMGTPIADKITQQAYSDDLGNKLLKKWETLFPNIHHFEAFFSDYVDFLVGRGDCKEFFNKADLDKNNLDDLDAETLLSAYMLKECYRLKETEYLKSLCEIIEDYCLVGYQ